MEFIFKLKLDLTEYHNLCERMTLLNTNNYQIYKVKIILVDLV